MLTGKILINCITEGKCINYKTYAILHWFHIWIFVAGHLKIQHNMKNCGKLCSNMIV